MADAFTGEIRAFAFDFPPEQWATCNGQKANLRQYTALFTIISDLYGPTDHNTYFTLPDLGGRTPLGAGDPASAVVATGMSSTIPGNKLGETTVSLTTTQMPVHTHQAKAMTNTAKASNISTAGSTAELSRALYYPATGNPTSYWAWSKSDSPDTLMSVQQVQPTGGGQPHNNMQPCLTFNYCICVNGYYPVNPG